MRPLPSLPPPRPPDTPRHLPAPHHHPLHPSLAIPYPLAISEFENKRFRVFEKTRYGRTDRRTDGPTDGRTDPLTEMQGRINKSMHSFKVSPLRQPKSRLSKFIVGTCDVHVGWRR